MSPPPFAVNVAGLRRTPGARRTERRRGVIDGLAVTGSHVPPGDEVDVEVVLEVTGTSVVVAGMVAAPWAGECRRCLRPVEGDVAVQVRELYEPPDPDHDGPGHHHPTPDGSPDDETYSLAGDTLDLLPLARDAVLLHLPQAPLCAPDCRGLCPTCGADLNDGPCDCPSRAADDRWAALDALRGPDLS